MKTTTTVLFLAGGLAFGQQPPQQPMPPQQPAPAQMAQLARPPMPHGMAGKWWDNPEMARRVGITSDQKKKMDDTFTQSRLKLIDLRASLEKDEVQIEALMQGPQLDDAKILPMIDRIAQDRAELEKADARLLLGIRHILTPEQWTTLNQGDDHGPHGGGREGFGRGPGGPGEHGGPGRYGGPRGPGGPMPPPPPQE